MCQKTGNLLIAAPRLAQHRAAHIGHLGHAATQAIDHGLDVLLIQPRSHHIVAADRKMLVRPIARVGHKIGQPLVFGRGRGQQQIIGPQPMGKLAKLGALVQRNMRLIHHQPNLQALRTGAGQQGGQGAHIVIAIRVIPLGAPLRSGHALSGGNQHRARCHLLVAPLGQRHRTQVGGLLQQSIERLRHQGDVGHKPEPQHIALLTHALQHLPDHESLTRPCGRTQQTRRRRLAQQGGADVGNQRGLKFLWLQAGGLGRQAQVQRRLQQMGGGQKSGRIHNVLGALEISNKLALNAYSASANSYCFNVLTLAFATLLPLQQHLPQRKHLRLHPALCQPVPHRLGTLRHDQQAGHAMLGGQSQ